MDIKKIKIDIKEIKKKYIWIVIGVIIVMLILAQGIGSIRRVLFEKKKAEIAELEIIGGLVVATPLTLLLTSNIYLTFEQIKRFVLSLIRR